MLPNSATQRMVVLPYDHYKKMSEVKNKNMQEEVKTSANEEKMLSLDDQMKVILQDTNLNDVEKLHKYSEVMRKYLDFKDKVSYDSQDKLLPRNSKESARPYNSDDVILSSESSSDKVSDISNVEQVTAGGSGGDVGSDTTESIVKKSARTPSIRSNIRLSDILSKWIPL